MGDEPQVGIATFHAKPPVRVGVDEHHLTKTFTFKNFQQALDFTNRVGAVAEEEGHHPDISLSWGKVVVDVCTHKIDGLTENDFIFAAKADAVL